MRKLPLAVLLAVLGATPALADPTNCNPIPGTVIGGTFPNCYFLLVNPDGSLTTSGGAPAGLTSTQIGPTITTHNTFQSALAASGTRKGCLVVNSSSDTEYIFFGLTASATTAKSIPVNPGDGVSCITPAGVLTDNVAITSKTTDGATYVVVSQ